MNSAMNITPNLGSDFQASMKVCSEEVTWFLDRVENITNSGRKKILISSIQYKCDNLSVTGLNCHL